jgi:hypothetical protein
LIGNKLDLIADPQTWRDLAKLNQTPTTYDDGLALGMEIGASRFFGTSAAWKETTKDILSFAVEVAARHQQNNPPCTIF